MNLKNKLLILLLVAFGYANSQNEKPTAKLKLTARYKAETGVELRLFPDRKKMLELGFQNGFILERSTDSDDDFEVIDTIYAFNPNQWENALNTARNQEEQDAIEIAYDFYQTVMEGGGGSIDMSDGVANLRKQKAKEDFQFMVFLLQAIRQPVAAEALGLSYNDLDVSPDESYTYRYKINGDSDIYEVSSVAHTIETNDAAIKYNRKIYTNVGDTQLSFFWEEDQLLAGVDVERADPGSDSFEQLNDAPIFTLRGKNSKEPKMGSFSDDSLTNYQTYRYKFYGYTAFGERIQFAEIETMPRDLTPPQKPFLKQPKHVRPDEVHIEWEMPGKMPGDFKGFAISRGDSSSGRFSLLNDKLLPGNARKFIDKSFKRGKTNYYLIQALDTANNVSNSMPVSVTLIDSTAPAKPTINEGVMDSLGVVTLKLKPNEEPDLMGYRLYRANKETHEFSMIQDYFVSIDSTHKQPPSILYDTVAIRSLTPNVFYKVEALDFNFNTSIASEIYVVKRIDTIPPTEPVFTGVKVREDYVQLSFELSRSKDVEKQILYRKINLDADWEELATLETNQKLYQDKDVEKGTKYFYTMRAFDNSGNSSDYSISVMGKPYDNGVRPPVKNLIVEKEDSKITLLWEYDEMNEDTFFVIYKQNRDGNLVQYDNSSELSFSENARKGDVYAIKVFTRDGGQSPLSELVTVE